MGHRAGKDIYSSLGRKIDNLTVKAPWNEALYQILKELYTGEEAEVVVNMPYTLSNLDRIARITGYARTRLAGILEKLADKGLVLDLFHHGEYYYMPSPLMVGIFEFTMMRSGQNPETRVYAEMFHAYLAGGPDFFRANARDSRMTAITRAIPHAGAVAPEDVVEILPYEKAESIVAEHDKFAIGVCACRHEKLHSEHKYCDYPLETCSSFGIAADYLIRHNMARQVSRAEMLENLARCRELGMVFSADNVQRNVTFICCCCSCCCNMLQGINKFGYANFVMTSSFIAQVNTSKCTGCGKCARVCPVNNIKMVPLSQGGEKPQRYYARVDEKLCLGCGVCALHCANGALLLKKRKQRVLHPETTFERNILSCLERGTLQYFIFDNPQAITHKVARGIVGGFLRLPPVKKALVGEIFRSRFLALLTAGTRLQGRGWISGI